MTILNIFVSDLSFIEDIFGAFRNKVQKIIAQIFFLLSQGIHNILLLGQNTIGLAPPNNLFIKKGIYNLVI